MSIPFPSLTAAFDNLGVDDDANPGARRGRRLATQQRSAVHIRSIVIAAIVAFVLLPLGFSSVAGATEGFDDHFAVVESSTTDANRYLTTQGSNAFNVEMYNNLFSGVFGDQHMNGVELFLHGDRIATNGDIHYGPTPEQWDATPAPTRGTKTFDNATNTITVPMTFSGATDGTLQYKIVGHP